MVNGFTANEIGDWFLVKLNSPYDSVVKVVDWEVQVGMSTPYTVGTLIFTQGSHTVKTRNTRLDWQMGQKFIVGNVTYTVVNRVADNEFVMNKPAPFSANDLKFYLLPDANNQFTYEFRWGQEVQPTGDPGQLSELRPLNRDFTQFDLFGLSFNPQKPLWIEIKAEVDRLYPTHSLTVLGVVYTLETEQGTIESCPQFCEECVDPWSFDGCANVVIECDPASLYSPYDLNRPTKLYQELSQLSTQMWGHPVKYFRVEPDQRSRDVILMEYSLYNVIEQGEVKVMVPNNEFPTEDLKFDMFGMGFEDFEIHITGKEFENVFGRGIQPRMRDYLYFPFNNKMYEVTSVGFADEFNRALTYWKVMLKKYEDRTSSIHTDTQLEQDVDNLTVGIEEIFGEEQKQEFEKVTKPLQYNTTHHTYQDGQRLYVHKNLEIKDVEIRNRWTVISKNYYDLSTVKEQDLGAVIYQLKSRQEQDRDLAFTCWFSPQRTNTFNSDQIDLVLFNGHDDSMSGLKISMQPHSITVKLNGIETVFRHTVVMDSKSWWGLIVNMSNQFQELAVYLYRLDESTNWGRPQAAGNSLELKYKHLERTGQAFVWDTNRQYELVSGDLHMTNIRLFSKTIEEEQHQNVLQQYVVRDADLSILADNAVPSINLNRYNQAR